MDYLNYTKDFSDGKWVITAEVLQGPETGVIPSACFLYVNTGTSTLGDYYSVCGLAELQRFQVWAGTAIPKFGNNYVRHTRAVFAVQSNADPDKVIADMVVSLKVLKKQITTSSVSATVTI